MAKLGEEQVMVASQMVGRGTSIRQVARQLAVTEGALRKSEIVLRLMRGEDFGAVSRETQVPPQELEDWWRVFLEGGTRGLKRAGAGPPA